MLRNDPIVAKYPKFLPSEEEVTFTLNLLEPELKAMVEENIAIGGCLRSSLLRFCWQSKQEQKSGRECAVLAVELLQRCIANRQRLLLDSILFESPFPEDFCTQYTSIIPFSIHGTDRLGHPVYITRYGKVDREAFEKLWQMGEALQQSAGLPLNAVVLYHLRMMEYITKVVMEEETQHRGLVVDRLLAIMDLNGLSRSHIQHGHLVDFFKTISSESVGIFPETLHATVVANVPWLISKAVWPLAKQMIHPVTQAKFSILSSQKETLQKMSTLIDVENIPPYLGGRCACPECSQGQLRGGSMWHFNKSEGRIDEAQCISCAPLQNNSLLARPCLEKAQSGEQIHKTLLTSPLPQKTEGRGKSQHPLLSRVKDDESLVSEKILVTL